MIMSNLAYSNMYLASLAAFLNTLLFIVLKTDFNSFKIRIVKIG